MTNHEFDATNQRLKDLGLFGLLGCWESIAPGSPKSSPSKSANVSVARGASAAERNDWRFQATRGLRLVVAEQGRSRGRRRADASRVYRARHNVVLIGPNSVGKTMIVKNVAYHAALQALTVRLTTASEMLTDLAKQESTAALSRRMKRYTSPRLVCIDEVGYFSYDNRFADLLFEVVVVTTPNAPSY